MKKIELLSPAGDIETLEMAIKNGADAIYIGGKNFGARAFAKNFNKEELKKAVDLAHTYDKKLYVTANTIIFENEIEDFLNYMAYLYEINVDAVIMQDLGMINLVHKYLPNLEIHASTQINAKTNEEIEFLKSIGVKRVVIAREMEINEIKNLKKDVEIEMFIHGALCVSYSGNCLFSSLNGGRSGNRGMCAGSCRLSYEINGKKEYPLSTKDLFLAPHIKEILDLNIDSLKIEGRMKSKEYVAYTTKVYRRLIDEYYENKNPQIKEEEIINFKKLFNRKFTSGYTFNDDIYNPKSPNHQGYPLGEITKINKKYIYIKLTDTLYQEDGIRFTKSNKGMIVNKLYDENLLLKNKIEKDNIAVIENKLNIQNKENINKTIDTFLIKEINKKDFPKVKVDFKVICKENKPLEITIKQNNIEITEKSIILEKALNKSTKKEEIIEKLSKLGSTPFEVNKIDITLENVFIPIKYINEIRRSLCEKLIKEKTKTNEKIKINYTKKEVKQDKDSISYLVRNEEQLKQIKNKRIYTEDYNLYKKYPNTFYKLPRIMKNYPNYQNENLLVSDIGSIQKYAKTNNVISDYPLNASNSETVKLLQEKGVKIVTISPEIDDEITKYANNIEKIVYGKLDLMILKKFPYNTSLKSKDKTFEIINKDYVTILHHKNLNLKNQKGNIRYILLDEKNITHFE